MAVETADETALNFDCPVFSPLFTFLSILLQSEVETLYYRVADV